LNELETNKGLKGNEILQAETAQEVRSLIGAGRKNLIINGGFDVWQRGTSNTTVATPMLLADRMNCRAGTGSTHTVEKSTDVPTTGESSFTNSLKFTVGATAAAIATTTGNNYFDYRIEGYDSAHIRQGTAYAKTVTLSFWVKSSVAGAYGLNLGKDTTYCYATSYTINSANTWEKKTITIPGTSLGGGSWNTSNGTGIRIFWNWGAGSNYTSGSVGWATADDRGGYDDGSAVQLVANANATWYITGIQLELGSVATDFEHRSYGEELALCQRYYQIGSFGAEAFSIANSLSYRVNNNTHSVTMRAAPSAVSSQASNSYYQGINAGTTYVNIQFGGVPSGNYVSAGTYTLDAEL
jgi:hypothetical protein